MHILYLAGEALTVVLLRIVTAFLLGIFLAALVIISSSIYPALFFHGILNLAGYLNLTSNGAEGSVTAWLWMSLGVLPLAFYGLYSLREAPRLFTPSNSLSKNMPG
jgi:hypothetical protein